jgi:hypothetical protein
MSLAKSCFHDNDRQSCCIGYPIPYMVEIKKMCKSLFAAKSFSSHMQQRTGKERPDPRSPRNNCHATHELGDGDGTEMHADLDNGKCQSNQSRSRC